VRDALALVGLPAEIAEAKSTQLSGGQRQRVALARATIVPPEVLLCDEPTSALDVSLAATVLNLLGRIRRELGMAMLFVTHDLGAARVVADRIAVMYLGRIVESGPATDITADPQHPYTKALLGAVPGVGVVRSPLQGEAASPLRPPRGCAFHPRCDVALERCGEGSVPVVTVGRRHVACVLAGPGFDPDESVEVRVEEVAGGDR
jgi:peptide/nickel transport system ATP-binding protein